jgi:heat-inducible transcriptional repressor
MTPRAEAGSVDAPLNERQAEVLRSVIRAHIESGDPVGSRTVSHDTRLRLSPASIRSIMADLEERGLLSRAHSSAGRVPTDPAYRFYVDHMIRHPRLSPAQAQAIDHALERSRGEVAELLGQASRQLSLFSNRIGLVLAPELSRVVVERMEFVRLDERRVVAILVGRSGQVHNRILELERSPLQEELDRIGDHLSAEFGGLTLPDMREALRLRLREDRAACDRILAARLELGRKALEADEGEAEVFIEGASNLLELPEFSEVDLVRPLLRALDEKRLLIDLLGRVLEGRGVQVVIGAEDDLCRQARCSLVASSYGNPGQPMGTVGIVGPTRMEYASAIALVGYLARVLTRLLSAG